MTAIACASRTHATALRMTHPTPSPFNTPPLVVQRKATISAAAHLLRGLIPHRPRTDWDGVPRLRALPTPMVFSTPTDEQACLDTLWPDRALLFQADHSAVLARRDGEGWALLPAPLVLNTRLLSQQHPPLKVKAVGTTQVAFAPMADPALLAQYVQDLHTGMDALFAHPVWSRPMGDVRLLEPWNPTLPDQRQYPGWTNWEGPSPEQADAVRHTLHCIAQHVRTHIRAQNPELPAFDICISVRITPPQKTGVGSMPISLHGWCSTKYHRTKNPLHDLLHPWKHAIKAWLAGPNTLLPFPQRHAWTPSILTGDTRATPTITAHQALQSAAHLQALFGAHHP